MLRRWLNPKRLIPRFYFSTKSLLSWTTWLRLWRFAAVQAQHFCSFNMLGTMVIDRFASGQQIVSESSLRQHRFYQLWSSSGLSVCRGTHFWVLPRAWAIKLIRDEIRQLNQVEASFNLQFVWR
jgi:hypothetical protein